MSTHHILLFITGTCPVTQSGTLNLLNNLDVSGWLLMPDPDYPASPLLLDSLWGSWTSGRSISTSTLGLRMGYCRQSGSTCLPDSAVRPHVRLWIWRISRALYGLIIHITCTYICCGTKIIIS